MRWTEAAKPVRISRDVRFATLYPAQNTCELFYGSVNLAVM